MKNREKSIDSSQVLSGEELAEKIEKGKLPLSSIMAQFNFLQGKVLTIIDASIQDERQNKALKDLIKNSFYEQMDWVTKLSTGHFGLIGVTEQEAKDLELEETELEENKN